MLKFSLLHPGAASVLTPRLGQLAVAGRKTIATPNYIPLTSRGVVSHVSHDVLRDSTSISSMFIGLEDFIERQQQPKKYRIPVPIYSVPTAPHESALRKFIGAPDDHCLILGPRREPSIACPSNNTPNSIAILTSVGYRQLEAAQYVEAIQKLSPDIVIGLADLAMAGQEPGTKRRVKMVDRTHAFTTHATDQLYGINVPAADRSKAAYFAPILPLENTQQQIYLEDLETDLRGAVSGLALYQSDSLSIVPESLGALPRLLISGPNTPHDILREVVLGADLLTIPFLSTASDSGIALDFTLLPPSATDGSNPSSATQPLAIDLWSASYTTDTSPLAEKCECYTCRNHHRAYLHHLLAAKEMLAWTLLQIHNHHTMDTFFAQIRESIQRGTFETDVETFQQTYTTEFPQATGQGPRLRGYQLPAAGPYQPRRYPPAYGKLDLTAEKFAESQSSLATPDTGADGLEEHGFAQKE
ncbi:tRNA-guanine transglycosylase family protein [Aspergillus ochraceoroseus]|uniref:Queuine tRNA-ribosyltransferase accessory subunit 2 n=1 Tax=Aspergillus ochraceoroseus TaxID=138278 RepID=A0A0F8WTD8_9EURO|nr:tRNA-guanine transglycosylase family protein [Aspergillus ochraceoroseus]